MTASRDWASPSIGIELHGLAEGGLGRLVVAGPAMEIGEGDQTANRLLSGILAISCSTVVAASA